MYSPPFRPLSAEEDLQVIDMINATQADIVWVGLGAPKQEQWMNAHKGKINGVMMGLEQDLTSMLEQYSAPPYGSRKSVLSGFIASARIPGDCSKDILLLILNSCGI